MNLELLFKILSVVFLGVAAVFLWRNNMDGVFVSAVIGAVCFFVSIRFQITEKRKTSEDSSTREHEGDTKIETE